MSDWSPHETDQHRAAGPVPGCDCHACAIDERNRLRAENERLRVALAYVADRAVEPYIVRETLTALAAGMGKR